jgi:hypothetical protein
MSEKRSLRLGVIATAIALASFLAVPVGMPRLWASAATRTSPLLTTTAPTTLDEYASYVQDQLQASASRVKTPGVADVRLTIGRDGSVRQTEVTRLDGPEMLRPQLIAMVNEMKLPPLPPASGADELVLDTIVAFNYPGSETLDRFGRTSER